MALPISGQLGTAALGNFELAAPPIFGIFVPHHGRPHGTASVANASGTISRAGAQSALRAGGARGTVTRSGARSSIRVSNPRSEVDHG